MRLNNKIKMYYQAKYLGDSGVSYLADSLPFGIG